MSNVWFVSDLHWGHRNICKYRPEFDTEEQHRATIKGNILGCIRKRDTLWILGDSVFTMEGDSMKDLLDVKKSCAVMKLVIGNHCGQHMNKEDRDNLLAMFDTVYGIHSKYGAWLTHAPVHPLELRGKFNIHGHVHTETIPDPRYINMCLEEHNYMPRDIAWLRGEMDRRRRLINEH